MVLKRMANPTFVAARLCRAPILFEFAFDCVARPTVFEACCTFTTVFALLALSMTAPEIKLEIFQLHYVFCHDANRFAKHPPAHSKNQVLKRCALLPSKQVRQQH